MNNMVNMTDVCRCHLTTFWPIYFDCLQRLSFFTHFWLTQIKAIKGISYKNIAYVTLSLEALKVDPEMLAEMLYGLFEKIWEEIPSEWKEGLLIKFPKEGDLGLCSNYGGITLLSVPGKVLNRVILERLKGPVDLSLLDQQAGFRPGRSCINQITTLQIIVEQSIEWNSPLYVKFVDYEKAVNILDGETLWKLV